MDVLSESYWDKLTPKQPSLLASFTSFFSLYPTTSPRPALLSVVLKSSSLLLPSTFFKSNFDQLADTLSTLLLSSTTLPQPLPTEWQQLTIIYLNNFVTFIQSSSSGGKGNKKLPQHILSVLPHVLKLVSADEVEKELKEALLNHVNLGLFNLDNLKRGLARESYTASNEASTISQLFGALKPILEDPQTSSQVTTLLPLLQTLYLTSLSTSSSALFPLSSKLNFPNADSQKSAAELYELEKLREASSGWLKAVLSTLFVPRAIGDGLTKEEAKCLREMVEGIVRMKLEGRGSNGNDWEWVWKELGKRSIVDASVGGGVEEEWRLLELVAKFEPGSLEEHVGRWFGVLARTTPPTLLRESTSTSTSWTAQQSFLRTLFKNYPSPLVDLLNKVIDGIEGAEALEDSVLSYEIFNSSLVKELLETKLIGDAKKLSVWKELTGRLFASGEEDVKGKKGVIRVLTLLVRTIGVPSSPSDEAEEDILKKLRTSLVNPVLKKAFSAKKKDKGKAKEETNDSLVLEVLELRIALIDVLARRGDGIDDWEMGKKVRDGMVRVLSEAKGHGGEDDAALIISMIKTLLQIIPGTSSPESEGNEEVLQHILSLLGAEESRGSWSGFLRDTELSQVGTALWELLVVGRGLRIFEDFASEESLRGICKVVVQGLVGHDSFVEPGVTIQATTEKLLRRADFFEFKRIHAQIQSLLLNSSAPPFAGISKLVPLSYLSKATRISLVDLAIESDLKMMDFDGVGSGKRLELRKFVRWCIGEGFYLNDAAGVAMKLIKTASTDSEEIKITVDLFLDLLKLAIMSYKSDSQAKPTAELLAFVQGFEKPLNGVKKGGLGCEDIAFLEMLDALVGSLGDFNSLATPLNSAITAVLAGATKPFLRLLKSAGKTEETDDRALAEVVRGCKAFWAAKNWIDPESSNEESKFAESCATFSQLVLSKLFSPDAATSDAFSRSRLAVMELLAFRLVKLRAMADPAKISTQGFETFVACCLTVKDDGILSDLKEVLKRATMATSLREYAAVVGGVSSIVASLVATNDDVPVEDFKSCLNVTLVILRDGPPGSSRLASACLSEILQHLSLLIGRQKKNAASVNLLLVVSKFLEEICGDSPLLLSRHDASSLLSLVCTFLQPSSSSSSERSTPSTATTSTASELFRSIVTIVDILVRHRKDHITSLFPLLVAALASITSSLRRAGFGTTGLSTKGGLDELETGLTIGRRAEREARATFAPWLWEAGSKAIGKPEAKVVGRLLGRLTAKTPSTSLKRKRDGTTTSATTITTLAAPLSKHAPFIILPYLRACADPTSPIPSTLRNEMQGGWFEVMDVMSKWEREALIKGFLGDEEELERGVLRTMWKSWEKERYRG